MDTDNVEEALSQPLLNEGEETSAGQRSGEVSPPPEYSELGIAHSERNCAKCSVFFRKVPTIVYIIVALVILIIILFLTTGLLPHSTTIPHEHNHTNQTNHTSNLPPSINKSLLKDEDYNNVPKAIHISLTESPSAINIQFHTANVGKPVVEIAEKDYPSKSKKFDGESTTYYSSDMCVKSQTADSTKNFIPPGQLHTVKVTDLKANTVYVYRAGISTGQGIKWGEYTTFRSSKLPGFIPPSNGNNSSKPAITFLALADQGVDKMDSFNGCDSSAGQNVSSLITSLVKNRTVDSIHIVGDLSYADGNTNIWDNYMDMIEPFASRVPTMVAVGNHEYDYKRGDGSKTDASGMKTDEVFHPSWGGKSFHDEGGECGIPFAKRFAAPNNGNLIFWYSFDQSLVHTIMLSSEHNMTRGSAQYKFLEQDLSTINRKITPWVVVELHRPMYINKKYRTSDAIGVAMRDEIEDLLHFHQVDLVISGHYHGYLQSCEGLFREQCANGGPKYVTIGTGGAPLDCSGLTPNGPIITKFDDEHFGVGCVSIYNASALHFEFVGLGEEVLDEFWLFRQRN